MMVMKCPFCGYIESKVIDSRPTDEGSRIRRRRECLSCQKRFTTYEIIESVPIVVVKKDRSREAFDRNKLLNGMLRACQKRPVSIETLEAAAAAGGEGEHHDECKQQRKYALHFHFISSFVILYKTGSLFAEPYVDFIVSSLWTKEQGAKLRFLVPFCFFC